VAIQTLYAFLLWHSTRQGKKAVGLNESTGKGRRGPNELALQQVAASSKTLGYN